ncbi:MAG: hypothetical protein ABI041_11950, partial [Bdellovibrionia bacterium]
ASNFKNNFGSLDQCTEALGHTDFLKEAQAKIHANLQAKAVIAAKLQKEGKFDISEIEQHYPYLKILFQRDAQVSEGYSVGEHTQRVLNQFEHQNTHFPLKDIEKNSPQLGDIKPLFKAMLVLHDIGKSLGNKKHQHAFTVPILVHYLEEWGFNPAQVRLAKELVNQDDLGEMMQGHKKANRVYQGLRDKAMMLGMKPKDFVDLQELFYVSDASSYPNLHSRIFTQDEHGKLNIRKDPQWSKLQNLIHDDKGEDQE